MESSSRIQYFKHCDWMVKVSKEKRREPKKTEMKKAGHL